MLKNVGMILVGALMIALVFVLLFIFGQAYYLVTSLTVTFLLIMAFSFWLYFVSYNTYPAIKKYVIDPFYNKQNEASDNDKVTENSSEEVVDIKVDVATDVKEDIGEKSENNDDLPEYVYHNGRMVHRSVLEQQNLFDDDVT